MHTCRVYTADVAPLASSAFFEAARDRMPPWRREKIDRFRFPEGKRLSLGAGLLLDRALASAGLDASAEPIAVGAYGKPYLPKHPDIRFNLSHSGTRVLCVLSDLECGCDVEKIGSGSPALVRRFFAEEEQRALALPEGEEPGPAWLRLFCRVWTRKESWLKATGEGIARGLSVFSVFSPPPSIRFYEGPEDPRYVTAVCLIAGAEESPEPEWIPVAF